MSSELKNIVVIGAGVVGLTTALKIQEKGGYNVSIIAETLPSDPKSIRYTSIWAGAHHVSHATDAKQQAIDEETFKVMWELSAPGGDAEGCFLRSEQTEYFYDGRSVRLSWMPYYQTLPATSLIPGAQTGVSFTTVTIDTSVYLSYLLARFLARGGALVRGSVQHIHQVIEGGAHVFAGPRAFEKIDALVVCPGLGARTLGGVEDREVYPVRGQVVIVRAPWVRFGRTASHAAEGLWTYIVPRRNGDVVLGGTKAENDWYPVARPSTTEEILKRCLELCPELAPPHVRAERTPTIDDIRPLILEEGCGFRPARNGGIRLDVEWVDGASGEVKVPVVFNYGHSGGGYQSSWGTANIALDLLEKALAEGSK